MENTLTYGAREGGNTYDANERNKIQEENHEVHVEPVSSSPALHTSFHSPESPAVPTQSSNSSSIVFGQSRDNHLNDNEEETLTEQLVDIRDDLPNKRNSDVGISLMSLEEGLGESKGGELLKEENKAIPLGYDDDGSKETSVNDKSDHLFSGVESLVDSCGGGSEKFVGFDTVDVVSQTEAVYNTPITSQDLAAAAKGENLSLISSERLKIGTVSLSTQEVTKDQSPPRVSQDRPGDKAETVSTAPTVDSTMSSSTALCKYRWAKAISTDSVDVGFYPSYAPTEPILLSWDPAFKAYLSPEMRIECGSYHGVLTVDGKPLPVEDFLVKSYTFEVDLFIKEDILETKCPSPPTLEFRSSPSNLSCPAPIPTTTANPLSSAEQEGGGSLQQVETSYLSKVEEILRPSLLSRKDSGEIPVGKVSSGNLSSVFQAELLKQGEAKTTEDALALKSPSPAQPSSVRRVSPIGDDKRDDNYFSGISEYSDLTPTKSERPSAMQRELPTKLIDDIITDRVSGKVSDEDGLPAQGFSRGSPCNSATSISNYTKQDGGDKKRTESRGSQEISDRTKSTSSLSSAGDAGISPRPLPTNYSPDQASFNRPADGVYGRPPSRPSSDHKQDEPMSFMSHGSMSERRYQDNDRRSPASVASRERDKEIDRDYSLSSRELGPQRSERKESNGRSGSRPSSGPYFRDGSQNKDGRQLEDYPDVEGRQRGSREGSYASRDSREGSLAGSHHSSRANSHTSLTSEQELGQYLDNDHRDARRDRTKPLNSYHDEDPNFSRNFRSDRPSSMPAYGAQAENAVGGDKRSATPDNRVRVPTSSWSRSEGSRAGSQPPLRSSLVTGRMEENLGGRTSVASSDGRRTVTPGLGSRETEACEVEDLRCKVDNLRQLVDRRDLEIKSLKDDLKEFREEKRSFNRDSRSRLSSESVLDSLEYKQLQSEKEILANEVVGLREEVQRLSSRHHSNGRPGEGGGGSGGGRSGSAISDYSPYSPMVLQRKIADLESQIRDLQEVNETTTSSLSRTEEKVRLLQEENHDLRCRAGNNLEDSGDQHSLRVQMRTLREDVASLKERNFQLTEENMRLQEGKESRSTTLTSLVMQRSGSSLGLKTDDNHTKPSSAQITSSSAVYAPRYSSSSSKAAGSSPHLASYSSRRDRDDLAPKDYRSRGSSLGRAYDSDHQISTEPTSSRLLHQSNSQGSPRLRFTAGTGSDVISHKPPNPTSSLTSRSGMSSCSFAERDRSRPDGEVSEHIHSDKYRPGVRSSSENPQKERAAPGLSQENHSYKSGSSYSFRKDRSRASVRSSHGDYRQEDTYMAYLSDSKVDRFSSENQMRRPIPGNSLGSKENRYISGNLEFDRYQPTSSRDKVQEDEDDSDTATDILLAQDTDAPQLSFRGGKSPGSDGNGNSSSDDAAAEDNLGGPTSLRRRCRSADPARNIRHSDSWHNTNSYSVNSNTRNLQSSSGTVPRSNRSSPPSNYRVNSSSGEDREGMKTVSTAGHRSVLPTPLVTQHNKHELAKNGTSLLNSSLTQGLRPFAPRSPADIRVDDVVKFSRLGGKLTQGSVKFVGHLPGRSEVYLGVELDKDEGKHDGTFEDVRYFKCKPNKGVFVAFNKIVMAWAP
ncbi:Cap-gly domain-containing linker protein 3 [Plakobranchus ocellatus]|uniref:Cap-gly domain-containing linker protein 3 n=1 Tax=Plakobranchus ocellatus TaxID=259542 RepID=A0AAV3YQG0_9GAST|nr:Cap-gly domain-containing linker protein 3 [Plakobranchus ocellatus]